MRVKEVSMSLKEMTDDDLRRSLFDTVVERLDAEHARNRSLAVYNRSPDLFSLQRADGSMLTIDRCDAAVLLRGQVIGRPGLDQDVWKFNIARTPDGTRLQMRDHEGSIDEIAESIVRTFLDPARLGRSLGSATGHQPPAADR
jgi:hypothetical protein